jgi:hypothetical protein
MQSEKLVEDAFDRARARGKEAMAKIMARSDMISAEEVSKITGMSLSIVSVCHQNGRIIGLESNGEIRYPAWQFDKKHSVVYKGIKDALSIFDGCHLTTYRYLLMDMPDGSDDPFYKGIQQGNLDLVLGCLEGISRGDFT